MTAVGRKLPRLALVTNIPAPYRVPIYNLLARRDDLALKVVFCARSEPDRQWNLPPFAFDHEFLHPWMLTWRGRYIHVNAGTGRALSSFDPDVVVTDGFNPTHLMAYAWARRHRRRHVFMTDGTATSEAGLSAVHRALRRHVYARSQAFIGAAEGARALYRQYGVPDGSFFKSHLCTDNRAFAAHAEDPKQHDLMFCGRFVDVKDPLFALDVADRTAARVGRRVSICFVGSGELESAIVARAGELAATVDCRMLGFARQEELPARYGAARVFLFPSRWDPWGVVANEACATGLPVVASPHPGAVGELIRHGENGEVLPRDADAWAAACARLLQDAALWQRCSARSRELVSGYTYEAAAQGIADAAHHAIRVPMGAG